MYTKNKKELSEEAYQEEKVLEKYKTLLERKV